MLKEKSDLYPYRPRQIISDLDNWEIGSLKLKVYGIIAEGQELSAAIINDAYTFALDEVPSIVEKEGRDNGMGFVIIHPGDLGVSVLVHWWIQGSILCQHIRRTEWNSNTPMDMPDRPVIACVWELGLINAEQVLWRDTMMNSKPSSSKYLNARPLITET